MHPNPLSVFWGCVCTLRYRVLAAALILGSSVGAWGTSMGDTYEQVIGERGQPKIQMTLGATRVLQYPDATIKIKDNKVISVKGPGGADLASGNVVDLGGFGAGPRITLTIAAPAGWMVQRGKDPDLVGFVDPAKRGLLGVTRITLPRIASLTTDQVFAASLFQRLAEQMIADSNKDKRFKPEVKRLQNDWWDGAYFDFLATAPGLKIASKNWLMKVGPNLVGFQCDYVLPDSMDEAHRLSRIRDLNPIFDSALKSVTDNAASPADGSHP